MTDLIHGDAIEEMRGLPDESVHLILTDPPYSREFEPVYESMAEQAARVLVAGGSLVTLLGHHNLPQIATDMSNHLRYWWIGGMYHNGNINRLPGKWVAVTWKPALWFVREGRLPGDTSCPIDMLPGRSQEKRQHEWQQPLGWFEHWIDRLVPDGGVVLDPFMGSGTTIAAALQVGRQAIGIEANEQTYNDACYRLREWMGWELPSDSVHTDRFGQGVLL